MADLTGTLQVYPRGVQLHLGSPKQPHLQDTLVMSNLGYFQLKSAPGAWTLQLAPGRSRDLYRIQSSTGTLGDQIAAESLVSLLSMLSTLCMPDSESAACAVHAGKHRSATASIAT